MDKLTELFRAHHEGRFRQHGATAKGVDWNDHEEMLFRYAKMLEVLRRDFERPPQPPSLLDVGCGWGGLYKYCQDEAIPIAYTGIDVVESMIEHARKAFPQAEFLCQDVFALQGESRYDYVVCNAILTQRLTASIVEMEAFANRLLRKMFALARYGCATNFMSTRVNYTADNLYYRSPAELLAYCLMEISPKVRLDHGYSSLKTGRGKFYDYTIYLYKD